MGVDVMLETIAWAVMLMCLGGVVVVVVAVAIFMLSKED
jgi:Trk-type K+ transport system membrane component